MTSPDPSDAAMGHKHRADADLDRGGAMDAICLDCGSDIYRTGSGLVGEWTAVAPVRQPSDAAVTEPHPTLSQPWGDPDYDPTCADCREGRHGRLASERPPYCPCAGQCHHSPNPCSMSCLSALPATPVRPNPAPTDRDVPCVGCGLPTRSRTDDGRAKHVGCPDQPVRPDLTAALAETLAEMDERGGYQTGGTAATYRRCASLVRAALRAEQVEPTPVRPDPEFVLRVTPAPLGVKDDLFAVRPDLTAAMQEALAEVERVAVGPAHAAGLWRDWLKHHAPDLRAALRAEQVEPTRCPECGHPDQHGPKDGEWAVVR